MIHPPTNLIYSISPQQKEGTPQPTLFTAFHLSRKKASPNQPYYLIIDTVLLKNNVIR